MTLAAPFEPVAGQMYLDVSIEAYHAGPGLSRTQLHGLIDEHSCPAKWKHDQAQPQEQKSAFDVGNAGELLALIPPLFHQQFVVEPEVYDGPTTQLATRGEPLNKRMKDHKAWFKEWEASLADGLKRISAKDFAQAQAIARAFGNDLEFARLLGEDPLIGASHYAQDPATGLLLKARPDVENDWLFDVKTCRDASPLGFRKSAEQFGYGMQAALYLDVVEQTRGERPAGFVFLCVEKEPPYLTAAYVAEDDMVALGRLDCRRAIDLYHECSRTGFWPGYTADGPQPLHLSPWETRRLERETLRNA